MTDMIARAKAILAESRKTRELWANKPLFESAFLHEADEDQEGYLTEKNVGEMSPAEKVKHDAVQQEAKQWHKDNPVHHMNIVHHYNQATAGEKHAGHTWYEDAHHITKMIAHDTKTPMHTMAGLVSNYSPQTHWATNLMTASKVAREKKALGGKGDGVFASGQQKKVAHKMLHEDGHYEKDLVGHKTKAFAHLIHHGGNKDAKNPQVVVDRHAHSVASGKRLTDVAFGHTNLKSKKGYDKVAGEYHKAAEHLSKEHGKDIQPHHVQATTWLVRQRLNAAEETASHKTKSHSKTQRVAQAANEKWKTYAGEHHPSVVGREPGTGYDKD
jgi:hypothetical protein